MHTAAQSSLSTILALLPSLHLRDSLKALLLPLLQAHDKARPQHSQTNSPSALSRFLNSYPWPPRALIRLARKEAENTLHLARSRPGPRPRLLVVVDLVTLEKRGAFPSWPCGFSPPCPPWMRKAFLWVVADADFGTLCFLTGVKGMGLEAVGIRRNRRTREGQRLLNLWRHGNKVYLRGLALFPATGRTVLLWGRRRFSIEHFFPASPLGADGAGGRGLTWREAARESLRLLLPELVAQAVLRELHALGLWRPPPKADLCRLCRRCKF